MYGYIDIIMKTLGADPKPGTQGAKMNTNQQHIYYSDEVRWCNF
jgi:hypothetical protein